MKNKINTRIFSAVIALIFFIISPVTSYATAGIYSKEAIEETRTEYIDKIVEIAKNEIGFYDSGINKYTDWYYGRTTDASWCCIFVSWCAAQAGVIDSAIPQRSSCDSMRTWFKLRNQYYTLDSYYIPQKGDIVFYNIDVDGTDNIHHVEIITEDGYQLHEDTICVKSIGGNTSNLEYHGSQYVMEKYRPVDGPKAQVVGFCHPSYEKADRLIGKINSFSSEIRNNDMKYIHSKFISFIIRIEDFSYQLIHIFDNIKLF